MLNITVPAVELFDEKESTFINVPETNLTLEHSLVSLTKWESKWLKPFMSEDKKTVEETMDYIRCMTITQNVNPIVYKGINDQLIAQIDEYINASMTATWFSEKKEKKSRRKRVITAELIYYWMIASNIPMECQKWHLNRLLTLIRVCDEENSEHKPLKGKDLAARNRNLNAARKKQYRTSG